MKNVLLNHITKNAQGMEVGVCAIVRRDQGKPSPQNPNTSQIIKLRRKLKVNRMHVINSLVI